MPCPALRARGIPIGLALLLISALATAAQSVAVFEVRPIAPPPADPVADVSHDLHLSVYTFRGTRWSPSEIVQAVADSARLLAQCRVALVSAQLGIVEASRGFHFYSTSVSRELLRTLNTPKPAVFFVEDMRAQPAFEAQAIGLSNARSFPELANTVWVAHGARDLPYAIAHELVHVLSDTGEHSDEPGNLMRDETSVANSRLTEQQCALLRGRGEANGLLTRR